MTKILSLLAEMSRCRARVLLVWLTVLTGSLIALPSQAMPSMKKADFETVYASGTVSADCFLDQADLSSVWDDELIRARITQKFRNGESGWLWLSVQCFTLESRNDRYVYNIDVNWTWKANDEAWPNHFLSGTYGIGSDADVKSALRAVVSDAVTKYLKANL